jgi:hypothetical protein
VGTASQAARRYLATREDEAIIDARIAGALEAMLAKASVVSTGGVPGVVGIGSS